MLETLHTVPWEQLEHAYGSADDVPHLLKDLTSSEEETRNDALYELYGNIYHQGTVYEATAYAVPFLLEMLQEDSVQCKADILVLLVHLGNGRSYKQVHQYIEANFYGEDKIKSASYQEEMRRELGWVKDAHDAVEQGLPIYLALLNHPEPTIRMSAAYTLSSLHTQHAHITNAVTDRLARETDPRVKASLLLCLTRIAEYTRELSNLLTRLMNSADEDPLTRLVAAMATAILAGDNAPPEAANLLLEAISNPQPLEESYSQLPWSISGVIADASIILTNLGPGAADTVIPLCLRTLPTVTPHASLSLVRALLYFAFGDKPLPKGTTAQDLTARQRTVLRTLVESDNAWVININLSDILRYYGIADEREELRRFLDQAQSG